MYKDFKKFWDKKWEKVEQIGPTDFALKTLDFLGEKRGILLDVGSGAGRDGLYFAEKGFKVEAFDFSKNALLNLEEFAKEKDLQLKTTFGDILSHSFEENKYDFIYACNSLHYFSNLDTKIVFNKLKSSLKEGGFMFIRVKSISDFAFGKGEKLEENYFKSGVDLKHFFSIDYMKSLFSDFEIINLEEVIENHNKIEGGVVKSSFIDIFVKKI